MTAHRVRRTFPRRPVRWPLAIGLFAMTVAVPSGAHAFWSELATGTGQATVATLPAPVVTATSPRYSATVDVAWTSPTVPSGMTITGYRVWRAVGASLTAACGTGDVSTLAPSVLSCSDTGLPDGAFDYVVTADVGPWTTTGRTASPVVVAADRLAPSVALSGAAATNALLAFRSGDYRLFFRPTAATGGSIRIDAAVTDNGIGPASAAFPSVPTTGWTHSTETVTSGTGSPPTLTYRSSAFSFGLGALTPSVLAVTGSDARANSATVPVTFVPDTTAPTGGALVANGVGASAGGSTSWSTTGSFTISAITPFGESETASASGLADVSLVRESASLSNGACGTFGGSTVLGTSAPIQQSGLSEGCYRYSLTGIDRVGNSAAVSTTVRIDTTAPTGGSLRVNDVDAASAGSTSITRTGTWSASRTDFVDSGSGLTSSTLVRTQAALASGACGSFASATTVSGSPNETSLGTGCYRYALTGINAAGLSSGISTTVWVDREAPTGGALTVNGVAASAAGTTSTRTTSTVSVSVVTGMVDAASGIASTVVTRTFAPMTAGVCGTFDAASETPVAGTTPFDVTGLADGCHRFTLTGTDAAGNSLSLSTTVRLDASVPTAGSLNVNALDATDVASSSGSRVNNWTALWNQYSDPESGLTTSTLVRTQNTLSAGTCTGTWGTSTTIAMATTSGSTAQTAMTASRCYRYVLTGTNALGLTSTLTTIVRYDSSAPGGGVIVVNGLTTSNATASTSTSITGGFAVSVSTLFSDAVSGMVGNVLSRSEASVAASVCGTFSVPTDLTLTAPYSATETDLAPGCYRYVLTGTNGVGGTATRTTTVRVDTTPPTLGVLTVNGVDAASTATTSTAMGSYPIVRTDFSDPETTMTTRTLTRASTTLSGGVCGTSFGTATTLTGAPTQSGLASACYRYVLTGINSLTLSSVVSTIVALDATLPTGGGFSVNGVAATGAGSSSTIAAGGSFSVTSLAGYVDAESGLASSTLTRTTGVSTAGICGNYDAATTVTVAGGPTISQAGLSNGCYRYVLTGVNGFGGTASVTSSVRVGP